MSAGTCTLCESAPATTTYGFPVCQPCADGLADVALDLLEMEAADPTLAEAGRRAEAALIEMAEQGGALDARTAEALRSRLGEPAPEAATDAVDRLRSGDRSKDWSADDHALADGVAMVERCGAKSLQIGYLVDDPPPGIANWYAEAEFRRGTVATQPQMTPLAAVEDLVASLMDGARCRWCGRAISWGDRPGRRAGSRKRWCWWRRGQDGRWERGCPKRAEPAVPDSDRP